MKRVLAFTVCLVMIVGVLAGCSSQEEVKEAVNVPVGDILASMQEVIAEDLEADGVESPLVDGQLSGYLTFDLTEEENFSGYDMLGLTPDLIEEGYALQAMMNVRSDKMLIIKAKDEASLVAIEEGLNKVLEDQENIWSQYLPDQYEKVQNNIIKTNGLYAIYITYDDPSSIEQAFDNSLNQ